MAFAIQGGRGSRLPLGLFQKTYSKSHLESVSDRVLHIVWALYYIYIVVEVTMSMAEYAT